MGHRVAGADDRQRVRRAGELRVDGVLRRVVFGRGLAGEGAGEQGREQDR